MPDDARSDRGDGAPAEPEPEKRGKKELVIVIPGRDAPAALVEYADLVTEMRSVKHPFDGQGIRARPGIEF